MYMPFGKHRHKDLREIPESYLRWCLKNLEDLDAHLWWAISDELSRRQPVSGNGSAQEQGQAFRVSRAEMATVLDDVVARWYREASRRWHPDHGGNVLAMQVVNDCCERLRAEIGKLADGGNGVPF
jgi:hypothetical protein